jgi:hypothetical protein
MLDIPGEKVYVNLLDDYFGLNIDISFFAR